MIFVVIWGQINEVIVKIAYKHKHYNICTKFNLKEDLL